MIRRSFDKLAMGRAISLGNKSRIKAPPNPWVGAVVAKNSHILGEGATSSFGGEHAEIAALKAAGNAKGATLYVTLEPCSHHGKTPPCVEAIINHQIARVVIALQDPDPNVNGSGITKLRENGIEVEIGLLENQARESLKPYLLHREKGRTFCLAKAAMSIDGSLAAMDGSSHWITGDEARKDVHKLRSHSQAIVVGSKTALVDDPLLTVRGITPLPDRPPLRVILDSKGRTPSTHALFDTKAAPTLVMTSNLSPKETRSSWKNCGAEVVEVELDPNTNNLNLNHVLKHLGDQGIIQTFFEAGPTLLSSLFNQRLIDQLTIYVGPKVLGSTPHSLFAGVKVPTLEKSPELKLIQVQKLGNSLRMDYEL